MGVVPVDSVYVVHAKTAQSAVSVGTPDAASALQHAREMLGPDSDIFITDQNGTVFSIDELEALIAEHGSIAGQIS
jgi:hypothetical protein